MEEFALNVAQLSVHVSPGHWKPCTAWGWHLRPSCWVFWETADDFCSAVWLTWLLHLQLSDFIFTSATCPLVPLFQMSFYLLMHSVPTTNLLHLLWFEKCSQTFQPTLVFNRKIVFPLSSYINFLRKPFQSLTFHWTGKMIMWYLFHPWHILSHLGDQEMTISTHGFHESIAWWIIFVVNSLSSWSRLISICKIF